jgi:hypothetical protein
MPNKVCLFIFIEKCFNITELLKEWHYSISMTWKIIGLIWIDACQNVGQCWIL